MTQRGELLTEKRGLDVKTLNSVWCSMVMLFFYGHACCFFLLCPVLMSDPHMNFCVFRKPFDSKHNYYRG
ncbi:hypothetical protein AOLI_G00171020 [Acnodon oligacanthus]